METQIYFNTNVLSEKQKTLISFLETNNPDILDYYSKTALEAFINDKIKVYYEDYERQMLLGFQPSEAEETAGSQLFNIHTSYSRLHEILVEKYAMSVDVFDTDIKEKIRYFSKEYRVLIDENKNISTLIDSFFLD